MPSVALNPADAGSWTDWVTNFDQSYQQFHTNYDALTSADMYDYIVSNHPELKSQYDDLVNRGATQAAVLDQLKATRDYVWAWLNWLNTGLQSGIDFVSTSAQTVYDDAKAAFGLSEYRRAATLRGLGIVPLVVIGVAAAAAALVVVGYWIKDAYMFAQRVNALKQQEDFLMAHNPGMSAQDAATQAQRIVDQTLGPATGGGLLGENGLLGIPWTLIAGVAFAVFLGPPLIEAMSGSRRRAA